MIESRYSIEYVTPDTKQKKSSKWFGILLIIGLLLAGLGYLMNTYSLDLNASKLLPSFSQPMTFKESISNKKDNEKQDNTQTNQENEAIVKLQTENTALRNKYEKLIQERQQAVSKSSSIQTENKKLQEKLIQLTQDFEKQKSIVLKLNQELSEAKSQNSILDEIIKNTQKTVTLETAQAKKAVIAEQRKPQEKTINQQAETDEKVENKGTANTFSQVDSILEAMKTDNKQAQ